MAYLIEDLLDEDDYYDDFVYDGIDGLPFQDDDIVKEEKSSNKVFSKVREFFRRN